MSLRILQDYLIVGLLAASSGALGGYCLAPYALGADNTLTGAGYATAGAVAGLLVLVAVWKYLDVRDQRHFRKERKS